MYEVSLKNKMSSKKGSRSASDNDSFLSDKLDSFAATLTQSISELRNEFSSVSGRVQACEAQGPALSAELNAVKADTGLTNPLYKTNQANMLALTRRMAIDRYNYLFYIEQPERAENARFRILRSAAALPIDLTSLSQFLRCDPSLITHVTPMSANSKGKMRLLLQFKEQAAAAAAAAAFRGSTNRTRAVLDFKRTRLQNARVGLAIQLQRVAREGGLAQATFRAEERVGWDFIVYRETPTAAPMAYSFIHHFPAGEPPAQGSPFISVDTATVTELLKCLRPLHSFPKPSVKPLVTAPAVPSQTTTNNRPNSPNSAPLTHRPNSQRPPIAPPRDLTASTSRALQQSQSLPASRSTTPRKAPPPFQGQNKRLAVLGSPPSPSTRPSAHSSPTRHNSPPRTNPNPNPNPNIPNTILPPPPPLSREQTHQILNDQM